MCAAQSLRKASSRLPLWGRWTRVSEDGEGTPLACIPAFGKPPSRHSAVRERRFAVSLAFFSALCAYKVKVVGRCPTPCKLFEKSLTKNF